MNECNEKCGCVRTEPFHTITKKYSGIENDALETVIDNKAWTIEVKQKPQQYQSKYAFPNIGDPAVLYVDVKGDEGTRQYVCIGTDYRAIKIINGGNAKQ